MLKSISIENFFSIGQRQELDFGIARNVPDLDGRFGKPIVDRDERFPKVIALYGANASGKTNLLRALAFLREFADSSAKLGPAEPILVFSFYRKEMDIKPTSFSVEFTTVAGPGAEKFALFRYELEIDSRRNKVLRESLSYAPKQKMRRLFDRRSEVFRAGKDFKLAKNDPIIKKLRNNASVISTFAQFNHEYCVFFLALLKAIQTNVGSVLGKQELADTAATKYYSDNPNVFDALNKEIRRFDLGIDKVRIENHDGRIQARFDHAGLDYPISLLLESQGTQNFYRLYPYLYYALTNGGLAIIDEIDNDIHPLVLPEIVKLFQDPERNPHNAQLIMSCHDVALIPHLVKEEIYLVEKDTQGQSHYYGLKDIERVRRDTNIYAKYLAGAFGAVPRPA